ncbi:MAG: DUF1571 domain-containing protein [Myxococcales bacterium]
MNAPILVLLTTLLCGADVPVEPQQLAERLSKLSMEERKAAFAALDEGGRRAVLEAVTSEQWLQLHREVVAGLGVYRVKLEKVERVDGKLVGPQTLELLIREKPQAIYAEYVAGPAKGRRLLYSAELKKDALRVREAGMLGFAGAVWLSLDSGLVRKDSNHAVTELGLSPLLGLLGRELEKAKAFGGLKRTVEGVRDGLYCNRYDAPPGAKGLYAKSTRICGDPVTGLPAYVEVHDDEGLLEKLTYSNVRPNQKVPADAFTLEGARL